MNVERQTAVALKWTAAGRLLGQLSTWAITLVVLRLLAAEDYGLMAMVAVVMTVAAAFAELGLGASLVQAPQVDRQIVARTSGVVLWLAVLLILLLQLAAPLVAAFFDEPRLTALIRVAAWQFLFSAASTVPLALATRAMRYDWLARIELGSALAASLTVLALAWLGHGVWSLVLGALAGAALKAALLLAGGERARPDFRLGGVAQHLRFGSQFALAGILWTVVSQLDTVIGGRAFTREDLGFYAVAIHVAQLPMSKLMSVINQVAFSAVARLQDDVERLRLRLLQAIGLMNTASVPLLWGLSAVAPELVRVALGAMWEPAIVPLQLVALVMPLRMASALWATAVSGVGRAGLVLRNTIVTAVVWPACFAIGVNWGPSGLAAAWLAAVPLTFMLNFPGTSRALGLSLGQVLRQLQVSTLAGLTMYGAVAAARQLTAELADPYRLPVLVAVGAATYLPLLWLLDRPRILEMRKFVGAMRG